MRKLGVNSFPTPSTAVLVFRHQRLHTALRRHGRVRISPDRTMPVDNAGT
jgi:hypothetical protein